MDFVDRILRCVQCGRGFVFSADEQQFFRLKNFINDPKRCKRCQAERHGTAHGHPVKETPVLCSQCGKETTVPFRPRGIKPVLCGMCFQAKRVQDSSGLRLVQKPSQRS